jgi:hypothetical protein
MIHSKIEQNSSKNEKFQVTENPTLPNQFNLILSRAARGRKKPPLVDDKNSPIPVNIYCPDTVLEEFRKIIAASTLPGTSFYNPYTEEEEKFPKNSKSFTARHLQILARNEAKNVTGEMEIGLYQNLLTEDQVARIRCLVKATIIIGKVHAVAKGGFPSGERKRLEFPEEIILIDQSGFQWQGDLRNTGGLFFYPNQGSKYIPDGYSAFQNDMYRAMFGVERPPQPSQNTIDVIWDTNTGKVCGKIDLDGLKFGIKFESQLPLLALSDFNNGAEISDPQIFKFLKAGFGIFCSDLRDIESSDRLAKMELARLLGICSTLENYPDNQELKTIAAISLPYSRDFPKDAAPQTITQMEEALTNIGLASQKLGMCFLGNGEKEDALEAVQGYSNVSTNCADTHAPIGNEGVCEQSVDGMLGINIGDIHRLCAAYNRHIECRELTIGINGYEFKKNSLLPSSHQEVLITDLVPDVGDSSPGQGDLAAPFVPDVGDSSPGQGDLAAPFVPDVGDSSPGQGDLAAPFVPDVGDSSPGEGDLAAPFVSDVEDFSPDQGDLPAPLVPDAGGSSPEQGNLYASFVPPTTSAFSNKKKFTCSLKPTPKRLTSQYSVSLPPGEKGLIPDSSLGQDDLPAVVHEGSSSDPDNEKIVLQGNFPSQDFTSNQGRFFTTPDKMVKFGFSAAIFTGTVALVLLTCAPFVGFITAALLLKCAIVLITLAAGFSTVGAANFSDGLPSPTEKTIR